jgi:hypothetical protein
MVAICLLLFTFITAQQKVIPLYKGTSPGSENWNWTEGETYKNPFNTKIVYNVTQPTLIAYLPDPAVAQWQCRYYLPGWWLSCFINR